MRFNLRRYLAVMRKEFLELRRNPLFFMMTILAPIAFYFLFAYGLPLDAKNNPMAVVDLDATAASRTLIDQFENATDLFHVKLVANDYEDPMRQMDLGKVKMVLVIPTFFEQRLTKGWPVDVQVLVDGAYPNTASLIGAYVDAILADSSAQVMAHYSATRPGYEALEAVPIELKTSGWYNSAFRSNDFMVPAIIALVLIVFPPVVGTISLAREKETGSILNMYCSSLSKLEYLLGKMSPYVIISYGNFLLFFVITIYLFDVPMRGSLFSLCFFSFFYVASAVAIGLLVAVLLNSQVASILVTFVVTVMPAFLYTGFMVPISSMQENAQYMSWVIPTTFEIDLLRKIMVKGASFKYLRLDVVMILLFFFGFYGLSIKLFKKRIG
jgi:ABC-2 type transport system permease protein